MDVTEAGTYQITAKTNVGIMQLSKDKRVDDVAFYGERVCYNYVIQDGKSDVQVRVAQYSGMISYFLNPITLPSNAVEAPFSHSGTNKNSVLVISADERKSLNAERGPYYMCVEPHMTSTYSIVI